MNIEKMYVLPEGSDVARIYEWKDNHLTFEELLSFIASRGKIPAGRWLERPTELTGEFK